MIQKADGYMTEARCKQNNWLKIWTFWIETLSISCSHPAEGLKFLHLQGQAVEEVQTARPWKLRQYDSSETSAGTCISRCSVVAFPKIGQQHRSDNFKSCIKTCACCQTDQGVSEWCKNVYRKKCVVWILGALSAHPDGKTRHPLDWVSWHSLFEGLSKSVQKSFINLTFNDNFSFEKNQKSQGAKFVL